VRQLAGHEHLSTSGEPGKALLIPICRRRDSNPHGHSPTVFKTVASAIPPLRQGRSDKECPRNYVSTDEAR